MSTNSASSRRSWSRKRRYAAVFLPALALTLGWATLAAQGAFAASLNVSGLPMNISADRMVGEGFAQYGDLDPSKDIKTGAPMFIPVAKTGIAKATLYNLCQSVTIPFPVTIPGVGDAVTLLVRAGADQANPVTAVNMVIDMTKMQGDATFDTIQLGLPASALTKGGPGGKGSNSMFGQQATKIEVTDLKQSAYYISAGTFALKGLTIDLQSGAFNCIA
jgi:hypothetical protein